MNYGASQRAETLLDIATRLKTEDPARILSALGHPGYGKEFAQEVLRQWVVTGRQLHSLIRSAKET